MRISSGEISAERYLAGAVVVSVCVAAIASVVPRLAFDNLPKMAGVLVASDLVVYLLMKLRLLGRSSEV